MIINQQPICFNCNQIINDRYIFQVDNQKLHYNCLKCTECKCPLNGKCWFKENHFYCKDDYERIVQLICSCRICKQRIEKNTLKYTINNNINVHLNCFKCSECKKQLNRGDHFVIRDDKVACSSHFCNKIELNDKPENNSLIKLNEVFTHRKLNSPDSTSESIDSLNKSSNSIYRSIDQPASHLEHQNSQHKIHSTASINYNSDSSHLDQHNSSSNNSIPINSMNLIDYNLNDHLNDNFDNNFKSNQLTNYSSNLYCSQKYLTIENNLPVSPDMFWTQVNSPLNDNENLNTQQYIQRKIRSKKRKLQNKSDLSNFDSIEHDSTDFKHQLRLISSPNVQIQNSNNSNSSSNSSTNVQIRHKRNRTTFTSYQQEAMKSLFAINQNPESSELLQLSKRTGLSKRVLQVWFQNSRAYYRKKNSITHDTKYEKYLLKMVN